MTKPIEFLVGKIGHFIKNFIKVSARAVDPYTDEKDRKKFIDELCNKIRNEYESPYIAMKLLSYKLLSPDQSEASNSLDAMDICVRKCGSRVVNEIGKYKFLNQFIRLLSPKYQGFETSSEVKEKAIRVLFSWKQSMKHVEKLQQVYNKLKEQDIIEDDPELEIDIPQVPKTPPRLASFEDEEKSQLLDELLKSKNPEDLQAANRLIKSMVRSDEQKMIKTMERRQLMETAQNYAQLLQEMLGKKPDDLTGIFSLEPEYNSEDLTILNEMQQWLLTTRPTLFRYASEAAETQDDSLEQILSLNDAINKALQTYDEKMKMPQLKAEENGLKQHNEKNNGQNHELQPRNMDDVDLLSIFSPAMTRKDYVKPPKNNLNNSKNNEIDSILQNLENFRFDQSSTKSVRFQTESFSIEDTPSTVADLTISTTQTPIIYMNHDLIKGILYPATYPNAKNGNVIYFVSVISITNPNACINIKLRMSAISNKVQAKLLPSSTTSLAAFHPLHPTPTISQVLMILPSNKEVDKIELSYEFTYESTEPHWLSGIMLPLQEVDSSIGAGLLDHEEPTLLQVEEYFAQVESGIMPYFSRFFNKKSLIRNGTGETLLIAAARTGQTALVPELLKDADVEETDNDGWSALLNAAKEGHVEICRMLLDAGAAVDQPDLMGWTPLLWATYKDRLAVVELLLDRKAHANIVGEEDGMTPLIVAAGRGFGDIVKKLLEKDVHVNACDKFGSTALIWAARKGYLHIVEDLLNAGVELDAVGMYSSTALMLATRGNYIKVVETILAREPNVNVCDYNGLSALAIAAREGYVEIAEALIHAGAFVNLVDRFGNSILASAVRSGNLTIVKMLLDKYSDVNARDSENRTPLHLAIDKSYMDIVLALLERKPNLELKNQEGETALLRAVKNRDVALCQLLVNHGAKIGATDNNGDNPLHLALRARSTRLTQVLLVNPSDSKLLYRPNKYGETPYSIDQQNPNPILPSIFGPIGADVDVKNMLGYDAYSDVLADIVCEPNLTLPLMIGLFAKWGSGKSLLLPKIRDSMRSFSRTWLDGIELTWSWRIFFGLVLANFLFTLVLCGIVAVFRANIIYPGIVGFGMFLIVAGFYLFVYYGSEIKLWANTIVTARFIARNVARFKLVLSVLTVNAPVRTDKDLIVSPVTFLFADDHRLSFIGGEHALTNIVQSLYEAAEIHYGVLAVRLASAFKATNSPYRNIRYRTLAGLPLIVYFIVTIISFSVGMILLITHFDTLNELDTSASYLIASLCSFTICLVSSIFPFYVIFMRIFVDVPVRRVKKIARDVHRMPFERMIQKLQKEVDMLVSLVHTLDAFTNSQTRLVIMVDGLDGCEQNKMVQIFDSLILFFSSRQNLPFIVILAVDPHIIIGAINQNVRALASNEITGHDYMKNNINMPFFLHHAAIKQLQSNLRKRCESVSEWKERALGRSDTFRESRISLRDVASNREGNGLVAEGFAPTEGDFANMNPRTVRRIVNSMALTGRLLRTFEIEFSWGLLYYWIALIEQWPYRMCWLLEKSQDIADDQITIGELYHMVKGQLPGKNILIELDRNPREFEQFLRKMSSKAEQLTVGQMRQWVACTSNLDPYLRKLIKDQKKEVEGIVENDEADPLGAFQPIGAAEYLFDDPTIWNIVTKPLVKMQIEDVLSLIGRLNIPQQRLKEEILPMFVMLNLNGLVLQSCDLGELQRQLNIPLGDWTLIRLLIETLPFLFDRLEPILFHVQPSYL
uniref:KAP NTPase domain-containing protein n=1 Tax=Panagrolaimus sp. JU765 TaxID=591449 RepID=A0AC34Q5T4_9BILA